jgi:predicted TIM-barrel fold metal-dependent hydrolase
MNLTERTRRDQTLELVMRCRNVYVDISCRATNEKYYQDLATFLDGLEEDERSTLMDHLLFGSDFAVNLMWIESYNRYIALFSETKALKPEEKLALCSTNPARFLFRQPGHAIGA